MYVSARLAFLEADGGDLNTEQGREGQVVSGTEKMDKR